MTAPREPDVDAVVRSPFETARRPTPALLRPDVVLVIFVGGCLGGWARYAITSTWPTPRGRFPWATFSINTAGAFVLAVIVVIAVDLASSRYLRPLLGTGFCGAFTTFSSIVVSADELLAHHHAGTGVVYLAASIAAGLAAAALGLVMTRAVVGHRTEGTSS